MKKSEYCPINELERLDTCGVAALLDVLNCQEFKKFIVQKKIDGRLLLSLTENTLKLWDHECNAEKLILLIKDLRKAPDKYLNDIERARQIQSLNTSKQNQYQTVTSIRRVKDKINSIDEIMRNIVPEKSFLYRNKQQMSITSYTPMNSSSKKPRKFYRFSSFEYPTFNIKSRSKTEDRGYYSVKINKTESKTKYKSMNNAEELRNEVLDDHFYEDLSSNDDVATGNNVENISNKNSLPYHGNGKPCANKLQELFQSLKLPFLKKAEEIKMDSDKDEKLNPVESVTNLAKSDEPSVHLYENDAMYDDVHTKPVAQKISTLVQTVPVEEYLVPICPEAEYCDVTHRQESLLGFILNLLESFGRRRDSTDTISEDYQPENKRDDLEIRKWNDERKLRGGNMADRPLPVPVENEPYYMLVDRFEAKNMLMGQPDGTFILRPSSQPNHVYTLSVSCRSEVHNVGVRRRPDGRLALGYARRGERSFDSITSLLKHHKKQRLLLVASGGILGATTLVGSPVYYQTPRGLPVNE